MNVLTSCNVPCIRIRTEQSEFRTWQMVYVSDGRFHSSVVFISVSTIHVAKGQPGLFVIWTLQSIDFILEESSLLHRSARNCRILIFDSIAYFTKIRQCQNSIIIVKELSERSNLPEHLRRPIVKLACSLSYNKGP